MIVQKYVVLFESRRLGSTSNSLLKLLILWRTNSFGRILFECHLSQTWKWTSRDTWTWANLEQENKKFRKSILQNQIIESNKNFKQWSSKVQFNLKLMLNAGWSWFPERNHVESKPGTTLATGSNHWFAVDVLGHEETENNHVETTTDYLQEHNIDLDDDEHQRNENKRTTPFNHVQTLSHCLGYAHNHRGQCDCWCTDGVATVHLLLSVQ